MSNIEVVLLVDNISARLDVAGEYGLSMWLTSGGEHVLFDTGMGAALAENAAALDVDLAETNVLVLSHGHFDHSGGLNHPFNLGASPRIYMHPFATAERYSRQDEPPHRPIGMRTETAEFFSKGQASVTHVTAPTQVGNGIWATGPIPRLNAFEDTGGPFFLDADCRIPDPLTDDQALWLESPEGIVVLLGCAHSGVVNTLDYIATLTGAKTFNAVIGGMHLMNASAERLEATAEAFRRYDVKIIAPCHCTGEGARAFLEDKFKARYCRIGAGSRFKWTT